MYLYVVHYSLSVTISTHAVPKGYQELQDIPKLKTVLMQYREEK